MPIVPLVADMNHNNVVDFAKLASAGFVGVILKARQGLGFEDPAFKRRRDLARTAGLKVGCYDFATHDVVADNVKAFLDTVGIDAEMSYWLDFEDNGRSNMTGDQASEFLDRVDQAIGRTCGIYGGNRIREQITDTGPEDVAWWALHPLWLCQYRDDPSLRNADLATLKPHIHVPSQWKDWFLLQYAADGHGPQPRGAPGVENGADLNAYDGTPDELRAAWALPIMPVTA